MTSAPPDLQEAQPTLRGLFILRHAKSSWDSPALPDHERPLDPRGERAALVMGRFMAQRRFLPDLVLCSTAVRAQETLALAGSQWPGMPPVVSVPQLYLNGERELMRAIMAVDDVHRTVMVVAHNPDLHDLVKTLARRGEAALIDRLKAKFPTAAFAAIKLPLAHWAGIGHASGTLACFATPRDLV